LEAREHDVGEQVWKVEGLNKTERLQQGKLYGVTECRSR